MSRTIASLEKPPIPPVFLFGFERSGTTLLSMMMGAHPSLAVPLSVTGLWYRYAGRLGEYGGLATAPEVERLVDDLMAEERIGLWDVGFTREEVLDGLPVGSFAAVVERFHCLYAARHGKPHWGNIDIATLDEMDVANAWFPDARFVHIVRDGRDVALSHETMPYGASNVLECAEQWAHRIQVNRKMGAMLGPERYLLVRYEDLVLASEETLARICSFVGLPYSPAMLDYPRMVEGKVPENRRWLWPALVKPPVKSKVFGWKTRMTRTRRIVFEGVARESLKDLGYETFERVPKDAGAYLYELWCFLGRGGRFRRLARKLGIRRASVLEREWRKTRAAAPAESAHAESIPADGAAVESMSAKSPSAKSVSAQDTSTESASARSYEADQQQAFGSLVRSGIYDASFQHNPAAQAFFRDCMQYALSRAHSNDGIAILECGCGPGAWLAVVDELKQGSASPPIHCYGFDLTPEMVETARMRLSERVPAGHLRQGDILKDDSYAFERADQRYQIIYAYDVVQQLPRELQFDACQAILRRLAPGGLALVFDQDRESPFGRKMGFKKFVTRYLGISLVPRYYCNARYPALRRFAARIEGTGRFATEIRVAPDGKKRALIVRAIPSAQAA